MAIVHTASMAMRSKLNTLGPDWLIIDITVKSSTSNIGTAFAPTWDMVMGSKQGTLSNAAYTAKYNALLFNIPTNILEELSSLSDEMDINVVLLCYCNCDKFCHRHIAANHLIRNFGFDRGAEITSV